MNSISEQTYYRWQKRLLEMARQQQEGRFAEITPERVEHLDPFTNTLFLFCGRRRDRIKALYWEGNGFVLLYKRLESGSFQWPRKESEARSLTAQQYRWLMEGLSVDQPKALGPVSGLEIV